ncbi:MAG: hypothetical protein OEY51_13080 [Cyclobacteriaceae bacterium]|nr:hypothetical protein [Cyclobacteriaceae bacterium]
MIYSKRTSLFLLFWLIFYSFSYGQQSNSDPVTYEEIYDSPETINKLFIQFQPITGEFWKTNPSAGFGLEATYFINNVARIHAAMRKPYIDSFDMNRHNAKINSDMDNEPEPYDYFELGGTYHFKDFVENTEVDMVLYKKSYRGQRWAARIPLKAEVACKVRKIYGARLGGFYYDNSVYLNSIIARQGLTFADITKTDGSGSSLPESFISDVGQEKVTAFGNIAAPGIYAGASISWIKNIAVDFDKHEPGVNDQILTVYADILTSPWIITENIYFQGEEYSVENIKKNIMGLRLGLDGKFNRSLSWGYGAELGFKPSYGKGGFFALVKISLPVFSSNLNDKVEAFGK